jgi:hypothetical protein
MMSRSLPFRDKITISISLFYSPKNSQPCLAFSDLEYPKLTLLAKRGRLAYFSSWFLSSIPSKSPSMDRLSAIKTETHNGNAYRAIK